MKRTTNSLIRSVILSTAVSLLCFGANAFADDVYSTDLFTITVPSDLSAFADIEADNAGVSIYETYSRAEYGGFVADIRAYESLEDFAFLPNYDRGGTITDADGKVYDLVIEYPSDVQFDYENAEATDNYNALYEAIPQITDTLEPAPGCTFTPQENVDTTAIYDDVLNNLADIVGAKEEPDVLLANGYSFIYYYYYSDPDPLSKVGYTFLDLNNDGYQELLIGIIDENAVFDLYAYVNGEAQHIFSGGERDIFRIVDNSGYYAISETASDSALTSEITFYDLQPNEGSLTQQVGFRYDAARDADNPYFLDYGFGDYEQTDEATWNERQSYWGAPIAPDYMSLADR